MKWGGAFVGLLVGVLVWGAMRLPSPVGVDPPARERMELDEEAQLERLRGGLRIPTISRQPGEGVDDAAFEDFRDYLSHHYPRLHAHLDRELISGHGLLYHWRGRVPELPAVVLLAHQDVVPVDRGSEADWVHPPFGAVVAEGQLWARGSLDDKLSLFAILEAVEGLLGEGFAPRRSIYLAFGHDEEIGGRAGASEIARLLGERKVAVGLIVDEGGAIVAGVVPGVEAPVAMVGVAEKGYLTLALEVEGMGGHSSSPQAQSAIGILSVAVAKLEARGFPARLDGASRAFFERGIGPAGNFGMRLLSGNLWLFESLLVAVMKDSPLMAAAIRTTIAPTIFQAGTKENVLPTRARVLVNFRLLPGDRSEQVIEWVRERVDDDRVAISAHGYGREASSVSSIDSDAWRTLSTTIREIFPGAVVAPYLVFGGTDSRHFEGFCDCTYRFLPLRLAGDVLALAHGTNERIPIAAYPGSVRFYRRLIENADAGPL